MVKTVQLEEHEQKRLAEELDRIKNGRKKRVFGFDAPVERQGTAGSPGLDRYSTADAFDAKNTAGGVGIDGGSTGGKVEVVLDGDGEDGLVAGEDSSKSRGSDDVSLGRKSYSSSGYDSSCFIIIM